MASFVKASPRNPNVYLSRSNASVRASTSPLPSISQLGELEANAPEVLTNATSNIAIIFLYIPVKGFIWTPLKLIKIDYTFKFDIFISEKKRCE
jgi:hypothetical protein